MVKSLLRGLFLFSVLSTIQVHAQSYSSILDGSWGLIDWTNSEGFGNSPDYNLGNNERVNIHHEIIASQNITLNANKNAASIIIYGNGKLTLENNGSLTLVKNANLEVKQGGELILGELITENNGMVDIIVSGTLRAEKVILKNEASIDYDVNFIGDGNLFISEIEFQGNASGTVFGMSFDELKQQFNSDGKHIYNVEFSDGTLPVELTAFDASILEDVGVRIAWTTLTETNNEYFVIEKSTDLVQWEQVELIPGAGDAYQSNHYEVIDYNPGSSDLYYRLCQYDFNGTSECFDVLAVEKKMQSDFSIYPNPAACGQPVKIEGNPQTIEVFNVAGQAVSAEIQNNQINNLPSGTYLVSLNGEMKKLIVLD
jgi:hypothetical protein